MGHFFWDALYSKIHVLDFIEITELRIGPFFIKPTPDILECSIRLVVLLTTGFFKSKLLRYIVRTEGKMILVFPNVDLLF